MSKDKIISFIDKCAFFFFIVLVFFLPISNAGVESSFGFILLCFIIRIIIQKPTRQDLEVFFKNRINFYLLLFYIAIGLSILTSGSLWARSLKAWVTKWGEGVLLFYFAQIFLNKKQVKIILLVMVASACLLGIDGIYQKITGIDFIRGRSLEPTDHGDLAITGSFHHYNGFASFLGVLIFITIGFLGQVKKFWQKTPLFLILLLISANVILTLSRGAWLSLFIASLFLAIFINNRRTKVFLLLFLISFTWIILSIPLLRERLFTVVKSGGDANRFKVWKMALKISMDSPLLGKGLGSFTKLVSSYGGGIIMPQYAHNCYLQLLAETGLLGLVSFMWFLGIIISKGFRELKERFTSLFFGLFFGFLVFLTHSFFDTQLFTVRLSILFWLLTSFVSIYLSQPNCQKEL